MNTISRYCALLCCGAVLLNGSSFGETISPATKLVGDPDALEMAYSAEFFVDVGLGDAQAATAVWSEALMQKWDLPFSVETVIFDGPQQAIKAIYDEQIDLVVLPPLQYLLIKDQVDLQPVLVAESQGEVRHPQVLLVRRDSGVSTLADLAGGDLAIARAGKGRIGRLWLETELVAAELSQSRAFFGQVREVGKAAQAVLPVFLGEIDACLVPQEQFATMVELNPQLSRKLMVLATSPAFCQTLVCLSPNLEAEYERLTIDRFQEIHTEALGRQILTLFRVERLVPFDPSYIEGASAIYEESQRDE